MIGTNFPFGLFESVIDLLKSLDKNKISYSEAITQLELAMKIIRKATKNKTYLKEKN